LSWYLFIYVFFSLLNFVDSAYCSYPTLLGLLSAVGLLRRRLYYTTMRAFIPIVTLAVAAVPSICAFAPMPTHKRSSSALQANDKFSFPNPVAEISDMFSSLDDVIDDFFNKRVSENHTIYTFCSYHIILCSYHEYLILSCSYHVYFMFISYHYLSYIICNQQTH